MLKCNSHAVSGSMAGECVWLLLSSPGTDTTRAAEARRCLPAPVWPTPAAGTRGPVPGHDPNLATCKLGAWPLWLGPLQESRYDFLEGLWDSRLHLHGMMKIKNYLIVEVSDLFQTKY